ncbi:MAG: response regulator [Anaerolineae bacterium]
MGAGSRTEVDSARVLCWCGKEWAKGMGRRILMVEDDQEMIVLGRLILERRGYEVLAAKSGKEGLRIMRQGDVDLVLLDIVMVDMDGWEVLAAIKADERTRSVPVIMLTARHYLEDEDKTAAYKDKFVSYVVKPFVVRDLLAKIEEALASS